MNHVFDPLTRSLLQMLVVLWPLWAALGVLLALRITFAIYRKRQLARSGIADIDQMDGIRFELYLVGLFRRLGYGVEHTPARGDYGADLILNKDGTRIAVQAKRYAKNVGVKAIQEVVTAQQMYKCSKALVVTNSAYTHQARRLAQVNHVELWDRAILVKTILAMQSQEDAQISVSKQV